VLKNEATIIPMLTELSASSTMTKTLDLSMVLNHGFSPGPPWTYKQIKKGVDNRLFQNATIAELEPSELTNKGMCHYKPNTKKIELTIKLLKVAAILKILEFLPNLARKSGGKFSTIINSTFIRIFNSNAKFPLKH